MAAIPPASAPSDHGPLLDRQQELAAIEAAMAESRTGSGRLVVIEGEAGIGKSAVLDAAAEMGRRDGMLGLRSSGSELEELHPFGVAETLLGPLVRESGGAHALDGPAEPARAIFDPSARRTSNGEADPLTILHAALWLVLDASERRPLLLLVDDAHWADEPSLRLLAYLAHRLSTMQVTLIVGTRPTASVAPEVSEQIRSHRRALRLPLDHLSRSATTALIDRVAGGGVDAEECERIWNATHGNPFYVVELLRAATSDGPMVAEGSVPDTIRASVRRRLTASGPAAQTVAEAIAILGDEATLSRTARLSGAPTDDQVAAVRRMTERAILQTDRLAFTHPIIRTAVLDGIPAPVRPRLHRTAADLLRDTEGPLTVAGGHLLSVEPASDPEVVTMLVGAARRATAQGDAAAAVSFLRRALDEPPASDLLGAMLLDLARAEAAAGVAGAPQRFDDAIAHLRQPHERAQARLAQGHALIQSARWRDGAAAFEAGLADVDARDVELKSRLEAGFVSSAYVGLTDHAEASRRLERILAAPLHDPAHRELAAWCAFQQTMAVTATASEAAALAQRALAGGSLPELIKDSQVVELVAGVLVATGDLDVEIAMLDDALQTARQLNAHQKVGIYSYCRSLPNLIGGRILDAIADADTALAVHEAGWEIFYPGTLATKAWAHLELDNVDAAERALEIDDQRWQQRLDYQFMVRIARGRVRAARGDHVGAIEQFHLARDAGAEIGVRTATILADWQTWCAVSLRLADRRPEAVAMARESLDIARRWGAPYGEGRAQWALGVALGDDEGIEHLRTAVGLLSVTPIRLETARAMTELGAALRRSGRMVEARTTLATAADLSHRIGAAALAGRARDELAAAGARPRRYAVSGVESLTPSELRVARMAAEGRTNREVAQALFVTPKAVEYHLANAYRKLGISSRADLGRVLRQDEVPGSAEGRGSSGIADPQPRSGR